MKSTEFINGSVTNTMVSITKPSFAKQQRPADNVGSNITAENIPTQESGDPGDNIMIQTNDKPRFGSAEHNQNP